MKIMKKKTLLVNIERVKLKK